mmetsp:Transcript_5218/g.6799  ORF Transcript_5218/g.6799 Transcript_5218/m.6799 type:complete len:178 (-) Transcript_5218:45-578(-)
MRIAVVPLRWGAGVKGKVNSAMSYGVPVICTTIAQEGMFLMNGIDAIIEDNPQQFAQQVISLYSNEKLWNQLRLGGYNNIENHFSISNAVYGMMTTFEVLLGKQLDMKFKEKEKEEISSKSNENQNQEITSSSLSSQQIILRKKLKYGICSLDFKCVSTDLMNEEGRDPLIPPSQLF